MLVARLVPARALERVLGLAPAVVLGSALAHVLSCAAGIVVEHVLAGAIRDVTQRARGRVN